MPTLPPDEPGPMMSGEIPTEGIAAFLKPLIPTVIGVVAGMMARWAQMVKTGQVRSIRKMILLDLPTIAALTLVAGTIAQHLQADAVTAAGIGAGTGYLGMQIVNVLLAWRTGIRPEGEA